MIKWGYRLYKTGDTLHFDQIVDGNVYALEPTEADEDRKLGWYDHEMKWIEGDAGADQTDEPPEREARDGGRTGDRGRGR